MLAVDAYLLYDWLSEPSNLTPEEAEQKRIEAGRAPGEIPTNENSSVAPNRMKALEEQKKKKQEAAKKAAIIDISRGDNPYANMAASAIDPVILQGKINAFNEYGVDRDKQRMSANESGISTSTSDTQIVNNAPIKTDITNNNKLSVVSPSISTISTITADLMQKDYLERTASSSPSGGVYTDARTTNNVANTSTGIVMPMGTTVDILDGGFAIGRR
jgi:hypothetical protein